MGLHQRRQAYLDRINNVLYPRFGVRGDNQSQTNITQTNLNTSSSTSRFRTNAFEKLLDAQKWVDQRTVGFRFEIFKNHKGNQELFTNFEPTSQFLKKNQFKK
jgi:hypothetical protein